MSEPARELEHHDATVVAAFADLGRRGDRAALLCDDERVTYGELDARANRVANGLLALGVTAGDVVAFALPTGSEIVAWYIGCARAGVVAAPLPTRLTAEELVANVRDCGAVVLAYSDDRAELIDAQRAALETVRWVLATDDVRLAGAASDPVAVAVTAAVTPDDLFCIMYTGGSTGTPKAAMQTHRNWAACIDSVVHEWSLTAEDRHLLVLPMSHVSWFTVAAHLRAGATTTMMRRWEPAEALELVAQRQLTVLNLIPTMLGDLLRALADGGPADVASVRQLTVAGSPLPVEMYERAVAAFGPVIGAIYGLTETSGPITFLHPADMRADSCAPAASPA